MTKQSYEAPSIDVIQAYNEDVITTSVVLPPHYFGSGTNSSSGGYDVF